MIIVGDYKCLKNHITKNMHIYNLSSYIEGFERVDILPPFQIKYNDRNFDIKYADYIFKNDNIFIEFMKIIISLYNNYDVYILIHHDNNIFDIASESIQKLIQQRYGIISNEINELEDWDYIEDSGFDVRGIYNLHQDKERYFLLTFKV